MRSYLASLFVALAPPVSAQPTDLNRIVSEHIMPRYGVLAETTDALVEAAVADCAHDNPVLRAAYHAAFDAWIGVSHLRFGPSEIDDRAFALAFWPDPRGSTPKTLASLISKEDPAVTSPDEFAKVSVAARGFYALEFLLYDPQFTAGSDPYHCGLVQAVARDIDRNADAILANWENDYAAKVTSPENDIYRSSEEATQQLFTALSTGLEFTSSARLGRPMGTFERPRPNRAEAWRSERSLRNVILSLEATQELTRLIAPSAEAVVEAFDASISRAKTIDDPAFASVSQPQGRLRVEALKGSIEVIRQMLAEQVGPALGIAAGFNSLDGV